MESLAILTRTNHIESIHQGFICVTNASNHVVASLGDPNKKIFLRSSAKPFQAIALVASGALEKYNIALKELAVICSSHSGQDFHREAVDAILGKIGLDEKALACGACNPYNKEMNQLLIQRKEHPTPLYNCCSGKHAGMLILCKFYDYPVENYTDPQHPVQQRILETMADLLSCKPKDIALGDDGCGVPNFLLTLQQASYLYAMLARGANGHQKYGNALGHIQKAMIAFPEMISGDGEFCTDLILHSRGRVIGKVGGEGVYCICIPEKGLGAAIKVADGNERAVYPVSIHLLNQLGILDVVSMEELRLWAYPPVRDHKGKTVGYTFPVFDIFHKQNGKIQMGEFFNYRGDMLWNH